MTEYMDAIVRESRSLSIQIKSAQTLCILQNRFCAVISNGKAPYRLCPHAFGASHSTGSSQQLTCKKIDQ